MELGFHHRFVPGAPDADTALLLLHGTGGDEDDLLPLGRRIAPRAHLLSPRGKVLEGGLPRFFRRHAEGVLDIEDLKARAVELAAFVDRARVRYELEHARVVAVGYSNGANVALGMLLERPDALDGAILARAMLPYEPATRVDLAGKRVLVLAGARDPYSRSPVAERLRDLLRARGAAADLRVQQAGHELTQPDVDDAAAFLARGVGA